MTAIGDPEGTEDEPATAQLRKVEALLSQFVIQESVSCKEKLQRSDVEIGQESSVVV